MVDLNVQRTMITGAASPSGGGCSETPTIDSFDVGTSQSVFGYDTDHYYIGQGDFTVASGIVVCAVSFKMGPPDGDISGKIFNYRIWDTGGSGALGSLLGLTQNIVGNNSWNNTEVKASMVANVTLSPGTSYIITVDQNGVDADNSGNAVDEGTATLPGGEKYWRSIGTVRSNYTPTDIQLKLYCTT